MYPASFNACLSGTRWTWKKKMSCFYFFNNNVKTNPWNLWGQWGLRRKCVFIMRVFGEMVRFYCEWSPCGTYGRAVPERTLHKLQRPITYLWIVIPCEALRCFHQRYVVPTPSAAALMDNDAGQGVWKFRRAVWWARVHILLYMNLLFDLNALRNFFILCIESVMEMILTHTSNSQVVSLETGTSTNKCTIKRIRDSCNAPSQVADQDSWRLF